MLPAQAAQGSGWSVLLDEQGDLQLSDPLRRYTNQFSPIELDELTAAEPEGACGCTSGLHPASMNSCCGCSPRPAALQPVCAGRRQADRAAHHRQRTNQGRSTLPSSDLMLPLPQRQPLDVYLRLVSEHQLRPAISLQPRSAAADQRQTLIYGLLFGCLAC
jgi:hypothetical protein